MSLNVILLKYLDFTKFFGKKKRENEFLQLPYCTTAQCTFCIKNEKRFTLTEKLFCQITICLVISLVKSSLSRNFAGKMRDLHNFHKPK